MTNKKAKPWLDPAFMHLSRVRLLATPALLSNRCPGHCALSLRVLEPLAGPLVPVLLPLFHTGITGKVAFLAQS